jgi:hypothetical protein
MKLLKPAIYTILSLALWLPLHAQDSEYNLDETYAIDQSGTIHLSSDDAEVNITGSDRSDVHLVVYRKVDVSGLNVNSEGEFSIEVENRGGDLHIREQNDESHRVVVGSIREDYRITIEAPREVALNLRGDDDTYRISNINLGIRINADDSDIVLGGTPGDNFSFDIDDGSIQMEEGRGRLNLVMDDGDFFVRQAQFDEIKADYDDGEIDITTTLATDGLYRFDMDDGELEFNIAGGGGRFEIDHDDPNIRADDNFEEISSYEDESVYSLPGGNAQIKIDTDDGRIELRTI